MSQEQVLVFSRAPLPCAGRAGPWCLEEGRRGSRGGVGAGEPLCAVQGAVEVQLYPSQPCIPDGFWDVFILSFLSWPLSHPEEPSQLPPITGTALPAFPPHSLEQSPQVDNSRARCMVWPKQTPTCPCPLSPIPVQFLASLEAEHTTAGRRLRWDGRSSHPRHLGWDGLAVTPSACEGQSWGCNEGNGPWGVERACTRSTDIIRKQGQGDELLCPKAGLFFPAPAAGLIKALTSPCTSSPVHVCRALRWP